MKNIYTIALLSFTAITACKKDKQPVNSDIVGKWEQVLLTGGLAGIHQTAAEWGHTQQRIFLPNGTCTRILDGKATSSIYSTREDTTTYAPYKVQVLEVTGEIEQNYYFAHDTLILEGARIVDGMSEWYVRK